MSNYTNFKGRASRSEYWWFYLFCLVIDLGITALTTLSLGAETAELYSLLVNLILFIPGLAVAVRRLHDRDRSGWWLLIGFTIIGLIPLIYWLGKEGFKNVNEYGEPIDLNN
jgi:uncharacterized membrane protein YhaH (DUF805 family)